MKTVKEFLARFWKLLGKRKAFPIDWCWAVERQAAEPPLGR